MQTDQINLTILCKRQTIVRLSVVQVTTLLGRCKYLLGCRCGVPKGYDIRQWRRHICCENPSTKKRQNHIHASQGVDETSDSPDSSTATISYAVMSQIYLALLIFGAFYRARARAQCAVCLSDSYCLTGSHELGCFGLLFKSMQQCHNVLQMAAVDSEGATAQVSCKVHRAGPWTIHPRRLSCTAPLQR